MFTFILFFLLTTSFNLQASQPPISFEELERMEEELSSIIWPGQKPTYARSGSTYGLRTRKRKAPTPPPSDFFDDDDDDDDDYNPGQDRRFCHERPAKRPRFTLDLTTPQQVSAAAAAVAAAAPPALLEAQATTMMNTISPTGGSAKQLNTLCWKNGFFIHYFTQHTDRCVGCCIIKMRQLQAESKKAEAGALKAEWLKRVETTTEMSKHANKFFDKYLRESESGAPCN